MRFLLFTLLASLLLGCGAKEKVVVFCAGSLTKPFERLADEFRGRYGVDVEIEASGSRVAAKKVSELGRRADVVALADWRLFPQLLYPKHCRWFAKFAANRLVLAYTDKSYAADRVTSQNWTEILKDKRTRWGHSDPDADPCGYRALLALQLAEKFYRKRGLYDLLLKHKRRVVRPKSVELVVLLQAGELDYAFEYSSVAVQHKLRFVELPAEINLGDPMKAQFYRQVKLCLSDGTEVTGAPIVYGVGVPQNAPHPELALKFVKLLLSETGQKILAECGQRSVEPQFEGNAPKELRSSR